MDDGTTTAAGTRQPLMEIVPNFSEGRRRDVIDAIVAALQVSGAALEHGGEGERLQGILQQLALPALRRGAALHLQELRARPGRQAGGGELP